MSSRRNPVASRAAGYFQPTNQGVPELAEQPAVLTAKHPDIETAKRIKRTFYLPEEDIETLDVIQFEDRRRLGKKPELSALVSEAIGLLRQSRHHEG